MTAENFQACLAFTLKYEGGRSNDPRDPGGRTMEGVTQAAYDGYRVKKALGRRDVFTIEAAERDEIYRNEYWDHIDGNLLSAGEDLCVFNFAVNSGPARALDVWTKIGPCKSRSSQEFSSSMRGAIASAPPHSSRRQSDDPTRN